MDGEKRQTDSFRKHDVRSLYETMVINRALEVQDICPWPGGSSLGNVIYVPVSLCWFRYCLLITYWQNCHATTFYFRLCKHSLPRACQNRDIYSRENKRIYIDLRQEFSSQLDQRQGLMTKNIFIWVWSEFRKVSFI